MKCMEQKIDFSLRFKKKAIYVFSQGQYVTDYYAADFSQNRFSLYFILNSRIIFPVRMPGRNFQIGIRFGL